MALDAERYRREVLDPARRAGNRPPDDLLARYQLAEPLTAGQVREQVESTLAHWHKQKASLAYRKVIDALEAEHRRLHAMFDAATAGQLRPLLAELDQSRARRRSRGATLRGELTSLAGTLGLLLPDVVEQLATQGHDPGDVQATIRELGFEVRDPDQLATEPPVRGFQALRENLNTLDCRHIADFLFGRESLTHGFAVLDGFAVTGRPSLHLDDAAIRDTATLWARRLEGKSVPESVLSVLRRLSPDERRALLVFECAQELRTWRDLRADSAALEQRAVDLGLVKRDAQRFAFAVGSERAARRSPLTIQLEELISDRRLVAAHRLVTGLDVGTAIPAEGQALADQARSLGGRALLLQQQARAATDPDTGWRLLDEAVELAADLSDVEQLRRQWPPRAPVSITATLSSTAPSTPSSTSDGGRVALWWPPSASTAGEIRYTVRRGPTGVETVVAETAGTGAEDPSPPVNVACWYTVVASRAGVAGPVTRTAVPVWFRPEVAGLTVASDDGLVGVAWTAPAGAGRVIARRAAGRPPRDPADGDPVEVTGDGFTDRNLADGVTYHYLICLSYVGDDGRETVTPGRRVTAASVRPPEPVEHLILEALGDEPGSLLARFAPPAAGTVILRELDAAPALPAGTRLPTSTLPGRPVATAVVPGGLKGRAPARAVVLLAVTVNGERAVIGDHAEWVPPTPAPTVIAQRRGDSVHLSWEWPPEVVEMEVRWRADDDAWQAIVVSTTTYTAGGGVHLPRQGSRTEVVVSAVIRGVDQRRVGPGARVLLAAPVAAAYTLARPGRRSKEIVATVTVARRVRVPRLVLLASSGDFLPLRATDGQVLAELRDVELDPATPAVLRAPLPVRPRSYWLRCFALPGDVIELRDPPREHLRVG